MGSAGATQHLPLSSYAVRMDDTHARGLELERRSHEVNRQLENLANGRALPENEDPTAREQELLGELDRIEWARGQLDAA